MGDLLDQIRSLMIEALQRARDPDTPTHQVTYKKYSSPVPDSELRTHFDLTVQDGSKAVLLIKDVKVDFKIVIDIHDNTEN